MFIYYCLWFKGKKCVLCCKKTFKVPFLNFFSSNSIFCHSLSRRREKESDLNNYVSVLCTKALRCCQPSNWTQMHFFCFLHKVRPLLSTPQTKLPTAVLALPLTHQLYAVEIITFAYIFARGFLLSRLCRFMGIFRQAGPRLLPNNNTAFCFPISLQETCSKGAVTLTVVWWNFVDEIYGKKMGIYPIWSFTWGWKCSNGSNQWSKHTLLTIDNISLLPVKFHWNVTNVNAP